MFAFYQLNCKNKVLIHPSSPLHYDIAIRINLKVTLAKGSFSQFLDVILTTNSIISVLKEKDTDHENVISSAFRM